MTYWIKALSTRPQFDGLSLWAWADHDGWHTASRPPAVDPVPTGQVWAWGPSAWATWREDHSHDGVTGCLLVAAEAAPGPGWEEADVRDLGRGTIRDKGQPIRTVVPADGEYDGDLYEAKVQVIQVLSPTRVALMGAVF